MASNLSSDDTVASEEGRGEDVHGTTFPVGHADFTTAHDGEGVAAISGDDVVVLADPVLEANENSFL